MFRIRTNALPLVIATCCAFLCGCHEQSVNSAQSAGAPQVAEVQDQDGGIVEKMSGLVEKAKAKAPSMDDVKKLLSDAGETTSQTADDSMKWVEEAYNALSERGMTSAKNASDWLKNDWNSMNTWEYQILSVSAEEISANPGLLETKLNESGAKRWDCFSVSESPDGIKFFMKRQKKSYLKNVPLKDMMKLVPLLDSDN